MLIVTSSSWVRVRDSKREISFVLQGLIIVRFIAFSFLQTNILLCSPQIHRDLLSERFKLYGVLNNCIERFGMIQKAFNYSGINAEF